MNLEAVIFQHVVRLPCRSYFITEWRLFLPGGHVVYDDGRFILPGALDFRWLYHVVFPEFCTGTGLGLILE